MKDIPRFVVTITDTQSKAQVSAGSDDIRMFTKPLPIELRESRVKNELDRMIKYFRHQVREIEKSELTKSLGK